MQFQLFLKQLGRNMKLARVQRGLKQIDVQEKIGLDRRHYQRIEAGQINITVETLHRLADLFATPVEQLVKNEPIADAAAATAPAAVRTPDGRLIAE